jgi:hypothetical protein
MCAPRRVATVVIGRLSETNYSSFFELVKPFWNLRREMPATGLDVSARKRINCVDRPWSEEVRNSDIFQYFSIRWDSQGQTSQPGPAPPFRKPCGEAPVDWSQPYNSFIELMDQALQAKPGSDRSSGRLNRLQAMRTSSRNPTLPGSR